VAISAGNLKSTPQTNSSRLLRASEELLKRKQAKKKLLNFCTYTFPEYMVAAHLERLADALERVERGELKRLIVVMPPRHGKSELVSLRFPCWYMGKNPTEFIVQAGYAESISLTHSRRARDIFVSPAMGRIFPDIRYRPETPGQEAIIPQKQAAHEWGTVQNGSYYAVGIGGGLTGRGFNVGIIDDPVKDAEEAESETMREKVWEWYRTVFRTRANPDAAIIIVMTRWHVDDLVGRVLKQMRTDPQADQWEVLHLKAINDEGEALWPERYDLASLESLKVDLGDKNYESLYQGEPFIAEGQLIKREWWQYYDAVPKVEFKLQSWDTAFKAKKKSDYSTCTTWGVTKNKIYLLDVWRDKVEFPELKIAAQAIYERDKPNVVLIEDAASGQSLTQELQRNTIIPLLPVKVDKDKVARANSVTPMIKSANVWLPEHAPWLFDFLHECSAFPNAEHDDQVDSMTQALSYIRNPVDVNEGQEEYDTMPLVEELTNGYR